MLYTEQIKKALKICYEAHKDQYDKGGLPYVFHPFHLAEQMQEENEIIVALLHDVLEDSNYTLIDLEEAGFSENIINALKLLTHQKPVPYMEYIKNIKSNPLATKIKLADLKHNSDINRLDTIDDRVMVRLQKYNQAILFLETDNS